MSTPPQTPVAIKFDNTYARNLEGLYVPCAPAHVAGPELVAFNAPLAASLGLDADRLISPEGVGVLAGNVVPDGALPLAQAYAGHQFGGFSPQLGDGRALLIGEVVDTSGEHRDIQLKGSGRTAFSRGGDGKAALGPVLREYMIAEAMYALAIPTTRALAAVTTGEKVWRETALPGAVLTRVASSHIRIGTFQYFAARNEIEKLQRLADYAIARHYPHLKTSEQPYIGLLEAVVERQAQLIARWMLVGFVHGVMNTDNMTISGETIDYGPCAFIDAYDPNAVFSTIDRGGRYAYGNQPFIGQWNLARLAETLIPLIALEPDDAIARLTEVLETFPDRYRQHWLSGARAKLGLTTERDGDYELATDLLTIMAEQRLDYTSTWRSLSTAVHGNDIDVVGSETEPMTNWLRRWSARAAVELLDTTERAKSMNSINPAIVPRNHKVEEALQTAVAKQDYEPFHRMVSALAQPYEDSPEIAGYAMPPPADFGPYKTFCGT
jgi:uncharacterized protein YdiU (UPF0061 family)